jgi:surface protein
MKKHIKTLTLTIAVAMTLSLTQPMSTPLTANLTHASELNIAAVSEVDRTALGEAIERARSLLANTVVSTAAEGSFVGTYWVDDSLTVSRFNNRITSMQNMYDDPNATQVQINNWLEFYLADIREFEEARTEGTRTPQVIHTGTIGEGGAAWTLYDDGIVMVESGQINQPGVGFPRSPWAAHADNIVKIVFTGEIDAGTSLLQFFHSLMRLQEIEGLEYFDTSRVTTFEDLFFNVREIRSLDLSTWDTSSLQSIRNMFGNNFALTELDVSTWNTRNVTNMSNAFGVRELRTLDISRWDTQNVTNMTSMFSGAMQLRSLDLSQWDVRNVTNMNQMFWQCMMLERLNLAGWNPRNITNMDFMFRDNHRLSEIRLGRNFRFAGTGTLELREPVRSDIYSGRWINVGEGSRNAPLGEHVLSTAQLFSRYRSEEASDDIWVWNRANCLVCEELVAECTCPEVCNDCEKLVDECSCEVIDVSCPRCNESDCDCPAVTRESVAEYCEHCDVYKSVGVTKFYEQCDNTGAWTVTERRAAKRCIDGDLLEACEYPHHHREVSHL